MSRHGKPTPLLMAGWFTATLPFLFLDGSAPALLPMAAAHVALAVLFLWRAARKEPNRKEPNRKEPLRKDPVGIDAMDWLPLILAPFIYLELRYLNHGFTSGTFDALVQGWEGAVFPGDPSRTWAAAWPSRAFSEAVHAGYLTYYPIIYVPPLLLHVRRDAAAFRRMVFGLMLAFLACYTVFLFFPVEGPRYGGPPPGAPGGPLRAFTLGLLESASSRGTAFPSAHVTVAMAQSWVTFFLGVRWWPVVAGAALMLTLGTVYGGFHYGVDALAGLALGAAAGWWATKRVPVESRSGAG